MRRLKMRRLQWLILNGCIVTSIVSSFLLYTLDTSSVRSPVNAASAGSSTEVGASTSTTTSRSSHDGQRVWRDANAVFHPHGEQICASGCALSNHPTPQLTRAAFSRLLAAFEGEAFHEATTPALDELLFYGPQAARWWQQVGDEGAAEIPLDEDRRRILAAELARSHARISLRVLDRAGAVRASLPPTLVPLDRRHEFFMETFDLQPLQASGTVKRVGRNYAWVRM